jgi:hypothetical protein
MTRMAYVRPGAVPSASAIAPPHGCEAQPCPPPVPPDRDVRRRAGDRGTAAGGPLVESAADDRVHVDLCVDRRGLAPLSRRVWSAVVVDRVVGSSQQTLAPLRHRRPVPAPTVGGCSWQQRPRHRRPSSATGASAGACGRAVTSSRVGDGERRVRRCQPPHLDLFGRAGGGVLQRQQVPHTGGGVRFAARSRVTATPTPRRRADKRPAA